MNIKSYITMALVALLILPNLWSCYKAPDEKGYLGEGIYLKGGDTLFVAIGSKGATDVAWLDNSTRPCTFTIENIRDANSNRKEDLFNTFPSILWTSPYDYLTDKTAEAVMSKLTEQDLPPVMINSVNGQIRVMDSTAKTSVKQGDVYNVDVRVTNSKGSIVLKDYVVIKFEEGVTARPFVLTEVVNGICVTNSAGENTFPYYDQLNANSATFSERRENVYKDNGKEFVTIRKVSEEPQKGIVLHFKLLDKNGKMFDPEQYASYSTSESYIDHSVNRSNSATDGMVLEFPIVPWPVNTALYSYIRGPQYSSFANLDVAKLKADNKAGRIPFNAAWPADDYANAKAWFVRIRSVVTFYESGTWEFTCKLPYATAK